MQIHGNSLSKNLYRRHYENSSLHQPKQFSIMGKVTFPSFSGLQCNMLPFIMGNKNSLPEEYQPYWSLIQSCKVPKIELGKVGYLTISESYVEKGSSQRRPGIHVEKHPSSRWSGGGWGGGNSRGSGLYMASSLGKTCRIWDCYVEMPGHMGNCEHLRDQLNKATYLEANILIWLTDGCPHESLPQEESGIRQYIRVVTSHVDLWYEAHSSKNPLVELPENVKIIKENKFQLTLLIAFRELRRKFKSVIFYSTLNNQSTFLN